MQWIKRNLFFVASCVVALALMVVAGVLAVSKYNEDNAIQEELNGQVQEAQRLYSSKAFPSDENIAAAKKQQQQLKEFRGRLKEVFTPAPKFPKMNDRQFKGYLVETIAELTNAAAQANVSLPVPFNFTFTPHLKEFGFPTNSIDGWLVQLADIKAICDVLYHSHINAFDTIQRVPIVPEVDREASEVLGGSILTNKAGTTFAPYRISFRSFCPELASVLEGFSRSTNCIIVKTVNVVSNTVPLPLPSTPTPATGPVRRMMPAQPATTPRPAPVAAEAEISIRYGNPSGKGGAVAPPPTAAVVMPRMAPSAATTVTILKEYPVQVTILLEIIRLGQSQ